MAETHRDVFMLTEAQQALVVRGIMGLKFSLADPAIKEAQNLLRQINDKATANKPTKEQTP